ncbi:MAG: glycoside hydrolase family 9 protein [Planctomycetota bacterium]
MRAFLVGVMFAAAIGAQSLDPHLRVDQFGYRPNARKVAVLRSAVQGFDAPQPFAPGPVIEVRRATDQVVVWSGAPVAWRSGALHADSGDRVWWADFTTLRTPGDYYVHDPASGRSSATFSIARDVYREPLRASLRTFFYQRCGVSKAVPHAHSNWADGPCHVGSQQDTDCRSVLNPTPATSRNLSGGWHDAGDYNKYVNFADEPLHALLDAFLDAPAYWPDDYGIPESGNGIPDLLDEIKIELDWLLRMQNPDGSLLHKVSVTNFAASSPPSADSAPRRYAPATASATATGCSVFAHAAIAYGTRPEPAMQAYAQQLDQAAASAWNWLAVNPGAIPSNYNNAGFQNVAAEDSAYTQQMHRIAAAAWRFVRSGDAPMRAYFDANYASAHLFQWTWASPWEDQFHSAWLAYSEAAQSTVATAAAIRQVFGSSVVSGAHLGHYQNGDDPYLAYLATQDYTWGSNATKCLHGIQFLLASRFGLNAAAARGLHDAAEGFLHYLHGVNPLGLTFLTNMRAAGAEGSVDTMYHSWFGDGTPWSNASTSPLGPAPGFLTGGPNPYFAPDPSYTGPPLVPPQGQPAQKSYRDWNVSWPQNSWEITEPAIGYQGRYVRLLAAFATAPAPRLALQLGEITVGAPTLMQLGGADAGGLIVFLFATGRGRAAVELPFWSIDVGLSLLPSVAANILGFAIADGSGGASLTLPALPAAALSLGLALQVSEVLTGEAADSAVVQRTVR